ncbi:ABC transporter permease [uncultured Cohaesibacter sp.]|uniref:ABC transporter permease n=1 Tax=uncultured Cohaesibacter sp. TaxID=1002546 RepID=UPI00292CB64D|nr:ABC transporter permease [uncultured Cohaesibacter sp.]
MPFFKNRTIKKEDYYTASQMQLVWARFARKRSAMVAAFLLFFFIFCGVFAGFLSPYDPTTAGRDKNYENGAPQIPQFCDDNGCNWHPFIHKVERYRGMDTNFRWVTRQTDKRNYLTFLPEVKPYRMLGIPMKHRLFGVEDGFVHLFGTDAAGKDVFSRTLHAIGISLAVGTIGVLISFVLALMIGGVAGFFGGWVDVVLQALMDTVKTTPTIPLFMALAAFIPDEWSSEMRFAFISMILGLLGWGTLARRLRTHVLAERTADYVLASKLSAAGPAHIIRRHLIPSFTSYIIVDLVISFPYMVLAETSLSFIGLGLKDPVNSLGVLLQNATKVDVLLNYHWYFIPVPIFVIIVLAFVFVGDGLRDAADPYSETR